MRVTHSRQFFENCVVVEEGDTAEEILKLAGEVKAKVEDSEGELIVVQFPGKEPELIRASALPRVFQTF